MLIILVGDEVVRLNPTLPSLVALAKKLEELGLVYNNGTVIYVEQLKVKYLALFTGRLDCGFLCQGKQ
jgi:hypothetical protein